MTRTTSPFMIATTVIPLSIILIGCMGRSPSGDDSTSTNNGTNNGTNGELHDWATNNCLSPCWEEEWDLPEYRFVLLEDLSEAEATCDAPGADIDAIAIERDGDDIAYAANVEDFNIGGANNGYADPNELLGAPDSACMKENFTSLGGANEDGWVIVSFENDEIIQDGDNIVVYELGPTVCPSKPNWRDDGVDVSVSVSVREPGNDLWVYIGTQGEGQNIIPVVGLE